MNAQSEDNVSSITQVDHPEPQSKGYDHRLHWRLRTDRREYIFPGSESRDAFARDRDWQVGDEFSDNGGQHWASISSLRPSTPHINCAGSTSPVCWLLT